MFGEKLPALWWVGAMGLVAGNVVIGRRDEGGTDRRGKEGGIALAEAEGEEDRAGYRDDNIRAGVDAGEATESGRRMNE